MDIILHRSGLISLLILTALARLSIVAQVTAPSFAVVSIKPNLDGHNGNIMFTRDGFSGTNYELSELIRDAFRLRSPVQLVGLPSWARSAHYDIEAKIDPDDASTFQALFKQPDGYHHAQAMLEPVLTDRFTLRFHWEQRVLPIYSLELIHNSSHLHPSNPADADKPLHLGEMTFYPGSIARTRDGKVVAHGIHLKFLADMLMGETHTIVEDDTHLAGLYDIDMQIPDAPATDAPIATSSLDSGDSLIDELYQLGLKLVPIKATEQVLVIDSIQRPSAN
ncbi:TIGR03435 family protein [Terracidiphilus sp.]|uniref:TIGR03435 family protein n=1 Tax=Terracidiphilus sp. TaxID=1964191 RepID=UPI003C141920